MTWAGKVLILFFVLPLFGIIPMLLLGVGKTLQIPLALGWIFVFIATIWLVICGRKNRLTANIAIAIALVVLTTFISLNSAAKKRSEENCTYTKTRCAKLDHQGVFYCGANTDNPTAGGIMVMHVEEKCMPTKEQSCAYAKQFCKLISPKDSVITHYKCDHETITCP